MDCQQVRPFLGEFASGGLPSFRAGWVAQHLAACPDCRRRAKGPIPDLVPGPVPDPAGASFVAFQRPVPRWLPAALAMVLVLAVGTLALLLNRPGPARMNPAKGGVPAAFTATIQRQGGVTLQVDAVRRSGGDLLVDLSFLGRDLCLRGGDAPEPRVTAEDGSDLSVRVESALPTMTGLALRLRLLQPVRASLFTLRLGPVCQQVGSLWSLTLPSPQQGWTEQAQSLVGVPAGMQLLGYGATEGLLRVRLRTPAFLEREAIPALILQEANGQSHPPVSLQVYGSLGFRELLLAYELPSEPSLPLRLQAGAASDKQIGPWLMQFRLVKS